jgi:hypothetical protein
MNTALMSPLDDPLIQTSANPVTVAVQPAPLHGVGAQLTSGTTAARASLRV